MKNSLRQAHVVKIMLLLLILLLGLPLLLITPHVNATAKNDWRIGNIVHLSKGTQIREGPGFQFCFHTIVPEDDWAVQVINGPRYSDNRTWYDTSRRAAGDPSGGTGWVNIEQVDNHPGEREQGAWCPGFPLPPAVTPTTTPVITEKKLKVLVELITWWRSQSLPVKIIVVGFAFVLLPASFQLRMFGSNAFVGFVRAILWGVALGGLTDLLRPFWESTWVSVAGSLQSFDPALVILLLPLGWWAFGFIAAIATVGVAIIALILVLLVGFIYVAYLMDWLLILWPRY